MSAINKVKQLFDSWAGTKRGEQMATGHDVLVKHILKMWDGDDMQNVLDVGCGNGRALAMAYEAGASNLSGIDLSENMIEEARKLLPNADLQVGTMENLSHWKEGAFSHVLSIEAIYYLADPLMALQEIHRVLRPDGKLAIAIDYYTESKASHVWKDALGFDITMLSEQEWVDLCHDAGIKGVKASRIKRTEGIKTKDKFEVSAFFPAYELYEDYIASGALLLAN